MDALQIAALLIFTVGYAGIAMEHRFRTHKSAVALSLAGVLWLLAVLKNDHGHDSLKHAIEIAGGEVFGLIVFLLSAMALVEVLLHFKLFDLVQARIAKLGLNARSQFLLMIALTFFISAILDNLTVTIIMIQIASRFYKGNALVPVAAGIVVAANAGGAWSPIGDVTTIMLWLEDKFSATDIIAQTFVPAAVLCAVTTYFISKHVPANKIQHPKAEKIVMRTSHKVIVGTALASFSLPILMNLIGLPPYMGLMLGLGVVWLLIEVFQHPQIQKIDEETKLESMLARTDIASIKFFIGVLLAVSALGYLGVLGHMSSAIFGDAPSFARIFIGNSSLGLMSALVDNVPLTAIAIDLIKSTDPAVWTMLALAVGTGGSALIIGSASGVVAMGMVKELNFANYLKIATVPVLLGYVADRKSVV